MLTETNHAFLGEKSIFFKRFPGTSYFKSCQKKYENFKNVKKLSLLKICPHIDCKFDINLM